MVLRNNDREMVAAVEYAHGTAVVRKIRGKKCRRHDAFMDELAAAFQFFYGFGENWSAVAELLRYLDEWIPSGGYVLVVECADELFRDTPIERDAFLRCMAMVAAHWATPIEGEGDFDRPSRPFHVVLELEDTRDFEARLTAHGIHYEFLRKADQRSQ